MLEMHKQNTQQKSEIHFFKQMKKKSKLKSEEEFTHK